MADMIKFLTASIAVAFVLGIAFDVFGTGTEVMANSSQVAGKGDRLDNSSTETVCGEWPFYHHTCSHDLKKSDGRARKLRIMSRTSQRHRTFLTLLSK
jgi:hypothetical protein